MKDKRIIFHPVLFAIYPILEMFFNLSASLPFRYAVRSLILIPLLALALMLVLKHFIKDWRRAGFLTSLVLFLVLYYGILYRGAWSLRIGPLRLGRHAFLFTGWLLLLGFVGSKWTWRRLHDHTMVTQFLNFASIVAIVLSVARFGLGHLLRPSFSDNSVTLAIDNQNAVPDLQAQHKPDIYYIIVDGYARADVLQEVYDFDNAALVEFLTARDFYVAEQSQTNYPQTLRSIASSLNFDYLDALLNVTPESTDQTPLIQLIRQSRARQSLQALGYQFITNDTGYLFTTIADADLFFVPSAKHTGINYFEAVMLMSSASAVLVDAGVLDVPLVGYQQARDRIVFSFETLSEIPDIEGPKFVFFHILVPHPPFLFDAEGQPVSPGVPFTGGGDGDRFLGFTDDYIKGYRAQLAYVNTLLMQAVDDILAASDDAPIIVIQGDHGPGAFFDGDSLDNSCMRERISILNAYHLPETGADQLYPSITPVNTFRIIFDAYFGTNLGLLADHSYYITRLRPYDFIDVGDRSQIPCVTEK